MASSTSKPSSRESILAAAATVAREEGVLALSVDRIVQVAGVSKGGFFYHFPSKEALLEAVVVAELDRFEATIEGHVAKGRSYAEGLVETMLDFVASNGAMLGSVTAALSSGQAIRSIVVGRHDAWFARLKRELAPQNYALLSLAVDGLIFSCSLRTAPAPKSQQAVTRRALRELAG